MDKKIYLSGGMMNFGNDEFDESNNWRLEIKNLFLEKYTKINIFNPNDYFNFTDDTTYVSDKEPMDYDLYQLNLSDIIIYNNNDPKSIGSAMEIAIAHHQRKPIFVLNDKYRLLHPWIKNMANRIFTDKNELVNYISTYYL